MIVVGATTIFARDDIRTYTIPKERHTEASPQTESSAPVKWTAPSDWQERAPGNMVIGSLAVPGKNGKTADVSITMFGGDVGGELANLNRWRTQLGLKPVSEPGKSEGVSVGGETGKLYELSNNGSTISVASVPHNGSTWFFKLKGDSETVENAKPAFREFLKSVQFTDSGEAVNAAPADPHAGLNVAPTTGSDPHAGLNIAPATGSDPHAGLENVPSTQAESDVTGPKMDVPATWKEKAPGPMVLKSYTVSGASGGQAVVAISTFPGDVGGKLPNVNRWRRQMGQPDIDDSQLDTVAKPFETGYSVDIEGTDAKTGKPARLIAIAIPHDGNTWFYKLLGDKNTVKESKATFLNFVKGVRY
ncbi:MAG: hypothetical protein JWO95_2447 [Verrucomicrobiales bacterium]|nr:hypothetical protein [Verrucomicrobiales bacterium]